MNTITTADRILAKRTTSKASRIVAPSAINDEPILHVATAQDSLHLDHGGWSVEVLQYLDDR